MRGGGGGLSRTIVERRRGKGSDVKETRVAGEDRVTGANKSRGLAAILDRTTSQTNQMIPSTMTPKGSRAELRRRAMGGSGCGVSELSCYACARPCDQERRKRADCSARHQGAARKDSSGCQESLLQYIASRPRRKQRKGILLRSPTESGSRKGASQRRETGTREGTGKGEGRSSSESRAEKFSLFEYA